MQIKCLAKSVPPCASSGTVAALLVPTAAALGSRHRRRCGGSAPAQKLATLAISNHPPALVVVASFLRVSARRRCRCPSLRSKGLYNGKNGVCAAPRSVGRYRERKAAAVSPSPSTLHVRRCLATSRPCSACAKYRTPPWKKRCALRSLVCRRPPRRRGRAPRRQKKKHLTVK